jgi:two-component system, NarL family, response regulator NreC
MSLRLLLVDDHAMFRAGLHSLLQSRYPDAELAEAGDGAAAIKHAEEQQPNVAILDLHLPDQNGLEVARGIRECSPSTRMIVLSSEPNLSYVSGALAAGVSAYLLKTSAAEELPLAIGAVLAGKLYLCPEANAAVLEEYRQGLAACTAVRPLLSPREKEVLRATADGLRTKEIATRLNVGVKTVETYRRRLMKKLACGSTAELVRYAMREGIIQP